MIELAFHSLEDRIITGPFSEGLAAERVGRRGSSEPMPSPYHPVVHQGLR